MLMNRSIIWVTLLFIVFFGNLNAQQINTSDANGMKQGQWKKYYESTDALFYEGQFKDNKPIGTFKHYYKNRKLRSITIYQGDTARAEVFTMKGKMLAKGIYVDQKKDSTWVYFNDNGNISQKETFFNGQKTGLEETFYPDGQIASQIEYINGVENGNFVMYYSNGNIENEGEYLNGRYNGNYLYYYDNKKKMYEGVYELGKKNKRWVFYHSDGMVKMFVYYDLGKTIKEDYQNGEFVSYYDSGMMESIGHYKNGKKEGYFAEYYNNGKRELVAREKTDPYEPDELVEIVTGQQIKFEKTYINDMAEGEVKYFNEDGELVKTENYNHGELITK